MQVVIQLQLGGGGGRDTCSSRCKMLCYVFPEAFLCSFPYPLSSGLVLYKHDSYVFKRKNALNKGEFSSSSVCYWSIVFVWKARMQSLVLVMLLQASCICTYRGVLPVLVVVRDKLRISVPMQVQYFAFKITLFYKYSAISE